MENASLCHISKVGCQLNQVSYTLLLEVKLPYDPVCPSVGWLVGRSVGRLVCQSKKILKGWEVAPQCSHRSTRFALSLFDL